jgi:hypothetical protein
VAGGPGKKQRRISVCSMVSVVNTKREPQNYLLPRLNSAGAINVPSYKIAV